MLQKIFAFSFLALFMRSTNVLSAEQADAHSSSELDGDTTLDKTVVAPIILNPALSKDANVTKFIPFENKSRDIFPLSPFKSL